MHDAYNEKLDQALARTVWSHPGMNSWYKNSKGRVTTTSPWRLLDYWRWTQAARPRGLRTGAMRNGATRVLLIGAGHAHVEVLRQACAPVPRRAPSWLLAVDCNPAIYSGMLPGFVAGQYRAADLAIDAVALARRAGAEVVLEAVRRVDAERRRAVTASGRELAYDFASLDVGIRRGRRRSARRGRACPSRPARSSDSSRASRR